MLAKIDELETRWKRAARDAWMCHCSVGFVTLWFSPPDICSEVCDPGVILSAAGWGNGPNWRHWEGRASRCPQAVGLGLPQKRLEEPAKTHPETFLCLKRGSFPNGHGKNFPVVILEITGHTASPSDSCTITCGQAEVSILERHPSDGRSRSIFLISSRA